MDETEYMSADGVRQAHPLFQAGGSGSQPTSALQLWFVKIDLKIFRPLCRLWHSTLPEIGGGGYRICYAAEFEGRFFAVALWSNPSSPKLPQREWIQLKRLAISPDAPRNTASRMMGWMAKDVARRFPEVTTLVSYRDCDSHLGTIYRACGWTPGPVEKRNPGTTWHNRKRARFVPRKPLTVQRWTKTVCPMEKE